MIARVVAWLVALLVCVDGYLAAWALFYDLLPRVLNVLVPMLVAPLLIILAYQAIYAALRVPERLQAAMPVAIATITLWLPGVALIVTPARGAIDAWRYASVAAVAPEAAAALDGDGLFHVEFTADAVAVRELAGTKTWQRQHRSGDTYTKYTEVAVAVPVRRRGAAGDRPVAAWLVERTTGAVADTALMRAAQSELTPVRGLALHDAATRAKVLEAVAASPAPAVAEPLLLEPSGSLAEATAEAERWALAILVAVHLLWVALPVGLLVRAELRGRPLSGAL